MGKTFDFILTGNYKASPHPMLKGSEEQQLGHFYRFGGFILNMFYNGSDCLQQCLSNLAWHLCSVDVCYQ